MSKNKLLFLLNRGCCFKKTTIDTTTTTIFPLTLPGSILLKRFSSSSSSTSTTTSNPNFNSNSSSSFTITSSPPQSIDTYQYVQALEQEGFSKEQSESLVQSFSEIINHSLSNLKKNMVAKADQEKNVHMYKVDFTALKSEIKMLEKNDFSLLKSETERLTTELEKLKQKMREEMNRLQAGVRLDMNLEKGRMRDESSIQEAKIRDADARIEMEVSNIRTQLESIKYEIIRNIVGTITAAGGLILAYLRFLH